MKSLVLYVCFVFVFVIVAAPTHAQRVQEKIPPAFSFANDFIQTLDNVGFDVEKVAQSKFNGGELGTTNAVWIKTNKGTFEALFYDDKTVLDQIQLLELADSTPSYHKYSVTVGTTLHGFEGRMPVFFLKHEKVLIISYNAELNDRLAAALR